jgi:16S rRNA (adenine1518-N6/adenine1519-N6)-dimethyltransferase
LTLRCRYEANASAVAHVSRTAFFPRPVVDSTLVRLDLLPKPRVSVRSPDLLFRVVRAAFGQRRKTVRNALLGGGIPADSAILDRAFTEAAIDPKRRAETLTLEEFASLADYLHGGLVVPRGPNHVEEEGR